MINKKFMNYESNVIIFIIYFFKLNYFRYINYVLRLNLNNNLKKKSV